MTFDTSEKSLYDGEPIELYKFTGSVNTYYLTTYSQTVTSSGTDYVPLAGLQRNVLKVGNQEEENLALDITMPYDHPLVQEYAYKTAPPTLNFELRRAHRTDPSDTILMWKGKVLSFSVEGRIAKMRVPALFAYLLNGVAPNARYQAPCNHVLYDSRCAVNPAAFQTVTTVTGILDNVITVASLGALSIAELVGGDMNQASIGENRMIISGTGLDLTVTYPYANLAIGDSITLRAGCDHSFATCISKFSNGTNFGGHPIVPDKNPFTSKP